MVIITTVASVVAGEILKDSVKDMSYFSLSWLLKKFLFSVETYKNELEKTIVSAVTGFRKKYPCPSGKVSFYEKEEVFSYLCAYTFYGRGDIGNFQDFLKKYPDLDLPDSDQLQHFFSYFFKEIRGNKKIRSLYIKENYQDRIFELGEQLDLLTQKIAHVLELVEYSHGLDVAGYVERGVESDLLKMLENDSVVLLTGISFCGKTHMARVLSQKKLEKNYVFLEGNDIDLCIDRLKRSAGKPTIYLLDDPFGHIDADSSSQNIWAKLRDFLRNFPKKHKLIVCSRIEHIYNLHNEHELSKCTIGQYRWIDLTVDSAHFMVDFWATTAAKKIVDSDFIEKFCNELSENYVQQDLFLQPGQLEYLINQPFQEIKDKSFNDLIHIARTDSEEISRIILTDKLLTKLYIALGFSCSTIAFVDYQELAYILSSSDKLIGYANDDSDDVLFDSGFNDEVTKLPQYPEDLFLVDEIIEALSRLEARGYIQIFEQKVRFKHPSYQYVFTYLLQKESAYVHSLIKRTLPKSFSSLNASNALVAIKQAIDLYHRKPQTWHIFLRAEFLKAISLTLFPSVKDRFTSEVLQILEEFSSDEKDLILDQIKDGVTTSSIFWSHDIPYYDRHATNYWNFLNPWVADTNVREYIKNLNNQIPLTTRELWDLIQRISELDFNLLTEKGIASMLNCDEIFIRMEAAYKIFKYGNPTDAVIDQVFSEYHPAVIVEGIKGVFGGFTRYSVEQKAILSAKIKLAIQNPMIVLRAESFFTNFGLGYGLEEFDMRSLSDDQRKPLWKFWGDLIPMFLDYFPMKRSLSNSGRFSVTLSNSANYLTDEQRVEIAECFYRWIDARLRKNIPLDSDELDIIRCLFEKPQLSIPHRQNLVRQCLNHWHTGFAVLSLSMLLLYWEELSYAEIETVLDSLDQDRPDSRWFKAVAVTRTEIPGAIQKKIFGDAVFFDRDVSSYIDLIPAQLLSDALVVSIGRALPFSYYGLHSTNQKVWQEIREHIIISEIDPYFAICIPHMLMKYVNTGDSNNTYSNEIDVIWSDICKKSNDKIHLLGFLIQECVQCNYVVKYTERLFRVALDSFENDTNDAYSLVAEYAEGLQKDDNTGARFFQVMRSHLERILNLEAFTSDRKIMNLFIELKNSEFEVAFQLLDRVEEIVDNLKLYPIKFRYCTTIIEEMVKVFPTYSKSLSKLTQVQYTGEEAGYQQKESFRETEMVENWTSKFRDTNL